MKGSGAGEKAAGVGASGHWALCGSRAGEEVCSRAGPRPEGGQRAPWLGRVSAAPRTRTRWIVREDFGRRWSGAGSPAEASGEAANRMLSL